MLEYSRLNRDTQTRRKMQLDTRPGSTSETSATKALDESFAHEKVESIFNLSTLTEDAVSAACLGFDQRGQRPQDAHGVETDHPATLVLNIAEALSVDWMFHVASGSWKRICINLVANALKYTPSGFINVTLGMVGGGGDGHVKRAKRKSQTTVVELVVSEPSTQKVNEDDGGEDGGRWRESNLSIPSHPVPTVCEAIQAYRTNDTVLSR